MLAVGAYERDDVGDLLFLLVTERCLRGARVVASAPFGADMRALLDRRVVPYGPLLRDEAFDVVWTVGGQVGAVDVARAYRMSAPPREYRRYARGSARRRAGLLARATGGGPMLSPYIPSLLEHPRNAGAISVLNSVGLSGVRGIEDADRRAALVALLRGQTVISVRDRGSSRLLDELGIEHALAPDAVHALGVLWPAERDPEADVAVIQISSAILRGLGHAAVGARITTSPQLRGHRPAPARRHQRPATTPLPTTGSSFRHVRGVDLQILEGRHPLDVIDQIRGARVVVGTSLHVRLIAATDGIPRVTLARWKPTRYARAWDADMPFDVGLDRSTTPSPRPWRPAGGRRSPAFARRWRGRRTRSWRRSPAACWRSPPPTRRPTRQRAPRRAARTLRCWSGRETMGRVDERRAHPRDARRDERRRFHGVPR